MRELPLTPSLSPTGRGRRRLRGSPPGGPAQAFEPSPPGERVPEGRVRGSAGDARTPPHPLPLPVGARATTSTRFAAGWAGRGIRTLAPRERVPEGRVRGRVGR